MSFGQFLSVLRARWWVLALILALTVGTTLAVSLLLSKQYVATASVVVDFKPDPISAAVYGGMPSPAVMATQVDIINSERVARRVVRNTGLASNPDVRQQWQDAGGQGTPEQWLLAAFKKSLEVLPSRESSVIAVSYKAPSPAFAAALANAFAQAYLETSLELRVNPARQYAGYFDTKAKQLRDELERAQSRVSAFQKEHGITATDERLDVETARLNELSSQLVAIQAVAAESRSRSAQAGTAADRMQEVLSNPLISGLKAELGRGEARLQELTSRLGDAHPQVIEARANLAAQRERVATETQRVSGGVAVTSKVNNQREADVRAALEAQRAKVLRMKAVRDEGLVLQRDLEASQRAYDAVQGRLTQTSLEGDTTQGNVHILTQASAPVEHATPNLPLNLALSLFLGSLLAVGTALVLELMDRRVRSPEDIVAALDLPVIGVMLPPGHKGLLGRKRIPLMQQRLMGNQVAALAAGAKEGA